MKNQRKNQSIHKIMFLFFYFSIFLTYPHTYAQTTTPQGLAPEPQQSMRVEDRTEELTQAFFDAVNSGREEEVRELISQGVNVNTKNENGQTALHLAVSSDNIEIVKLLVEASIDVNTKNDDDQAPLDIILSRNRLQITRNPNHEEIKEMLLSNGAEVFSIHAAVQTGDVERVKAFLEKEPDINSKDGGGDTALLLAVYSDNNDITELLIDNGADVNIGDSGNYTPLYYAVWSLNKDMINLLVSNGADVNFSAQEGDSLFYEAIWMMNFDIVKILVDNGAKYDLKDADGYTAMHYAIWQGSMDMVELFISKGIDTSSIHMAACVGDLAKVQEFIEQGVRVDATDEAGWTALIWAASAGRKEIAEYLIDNNADINLTIGRQNQSLLHLAAMSGNLGLVELLLSEGIYANISDGTGRTPISEASAAGHLEIVKLLVSHGADVNIEDQDNTLPLLRRSTMQPLYRAVLGGHKDVVEYLLDNGAETNVQILGGRTLLDISRQRGYAEIAELLSQHGVKETLFSAVSSNNIEQIKLLISQGADVNAGTVFGGSLLLQTIRANNLEMADLLISAGADIHARTEQNGFTPLHHMASGGNKAGAEYLISKGADIQAGNRWGATPLHVAAANNRPEVVKLLLEKGADLDARASYDNTVLSTAVDNGNKDMFEILIANGADVNATTRNMTVLHTAMIRDQKEMVQYIAEKYIEITPVNLAAYYGELDTVKKYIEDGLDINEKDISGFSPLHCAVCGNHIEVVEYLIGQGANVNSRDSFERTPICYTANIDMATLLITEGADANIKDKIGETLLHWSVNRNNQQGIIELVELYLTNGADVNSKAYSTCKDWEGWTPFHVACRNGNLEIVELLIEYGADINAETDNGDTPLSLVQLESQNRPLQARNSIAVIQFLQDYQHSLIRRELPQLSDFGINISQAGVNGKRILLCFFDMEQRPSRNCINQLSERAEQLEQENITIFVVQASEIEQEVFDNWIQENNLPFSAGVLPGNTEEKLRNWGIEAMPWLILTDAEHIVIAEGFSINELDEKIALSE